MSEKKECRWQCKYWAADPDGEYCAHPKALEVSPFGINLNRALGPNGQYTKEMMTTDPAIGICGPERKLWELRPPVFKNEAEPMEPERSMNVEIGYYRFTKPSKHLFRWSRLFQAVVSQAGTYLCTKRFHNHECAIYKTEGGCRIDGVGDLVLSRSCCYFDYRVGGEHVQTIADMITAIVLAFDPMNPIDSIIKSAADFVGCDSDKLKEAVLNSRTGGVFGGNALADFFRWNPFSRPPEDRDYDRWIMVDFLKKATNEEMDQKFKDEDLGEELLNKLQQKFKDQKHWFAPFCCNPHRDPNGELWFWINTGRQTNIDGRRSLKEIEDFLKPEVKIIDRAKY